jgi:hypothetical protein
MFAEIDTLIEVLEGLQKIKAEAQKKINQLLAAVWVVEFSEPVLEAAEND